MLWYQEGSNDAAHDNIPGDTIFVGKGMIQIIVVKAWYTVDTRIKTKIDNTTFKGIFRDHSRDNALNFHQNPRNIPDVCRYIFYDTEGGKGALRLEYPARAMPRGRHVQESLGVSIDKRAVRSRFFYIYI